MQNITTPAPLSFVNYTYLEDTPASFYWSLCSIIHCPTARSLFAPQMLVQLPFPAATPGTDGCLVPLLILLHRFCPYALLRLYYSASRLLLPPHVCLCHSVLVRLNRDALLSHPIRHLDRCVSSDAVRQGSTMWPSNPRPMTSSISLEGTPNASPPVPPPRTDVPTPASPPFARKLTLPSRPLGPDFGYFL